MTADSEVSITGTPEASAVTGVRRSRGKNKSAAWRHDGLVSVIRLPLVVDDPVVRRRVELLFWSMWQVKRAVQHEARARVDGYQAGSHRRNADAKAWRTECGLTRERLERAAYTFVERSGWLQHHVTKALALHQADEVWAGVARHLFPDAAGRYAGPPKVGSWWDYTRIPGRARSHTRPRKWETFRLHGSLEGQLAAYPAQAALCGTARPGESVMAQPRRLRPPEPPRSWWSYGGPLMVVFGGGPDSRRGDLVLPVRLPQGAGRLPYLEHYLGRPETWHKVDLVRRRCPSAPGGWTYEAHLLILGSGYTSPSTEARRAVVPQDRRGGVDGNVSNLSVVSFPADLDPATGPVVGSEIRLTEAERDAADRDRLRRRRTQRALDRSRRASNTRHYQLSRRQARRAARRAAAGLAERAVQLPKGPRVADAAGRPKQAHRRDEISGSYHRMRARKAADEAGRAEARRQRAAQVAARIVAVHGPQLTVEDCHITAWFKLWGRACAAFTPGLLITALTTECERAGGRLLRASTFSTALSRHCLCGARVGKILAERVHRCPVCGLTGDRDRVSAALGAFVTLTDPDDPATATVNYQASTHALRVFSPGLQRALREPTATHPRRLRAGGVRQPPSRVASTRRTRECTVPTPNPAPTEPTGQTRIRNPGCLQHPGNSP